jgi:hypothetical protein
VRLSYAVRENKSFYLIFLLLTFPVYYPGTTLKRSYSSTSSIKYASASLKKSTFVTRSRFLNESETCLSSFFMTALHNRVERSQIYTILEKTFEHGICSKRPRNRSNVSFFLSRRKESVQLVLDVLIYLII